MEMENMSRKTITCSNKEEDDDVPLPGFRFRPTDEELLGFYLRRKVERRHISIELIKEADIYKFDPWDLPKSNNVGDKEWYFFCKRGRKYKNSVRPNRVTGSGFWKATGIDKPIYSSGGEGRDCIGLKKSLVYYRGSAGKGTKTDWMMHEFRLPATHDESTPKQMDYAKNLDQQAEVWTLCRILKRNVSYRKGVPDWKGVPARRSRMIINPAVDATSEIRSVESCERHPQSDYISFNAPELRTGENEKKPSSAHVESIPNQHFPVHFSSSVMSQAPFAASLFSSNGCSDVNEWLGPTDWEDLRSIVDSAAAPSATNPSHL